MSVFPNQLLLACTYPLTVIVNVLRIISYHTMSRTALYPIKPAISTLNASVLCVLEPPFTSPRYDGLRNERARGLQRSLHA